MSSNSKPELTQQQQLTLPTEIPIPSRDTAPFIYDVGMRTLKGAAIGYALGFVFFRRAATRRFCLYYGAGFGIGMSYQNMRYLYGRLMGEKDVDK